MIFKVKIFCICAVFIFPTLPTLLPKSYSNLERFRKGLEAFGVNLYSELTQIRRGENFIVSPISIHTCVGMLRMGAEGNTAREIDHGLSLPEQDFEHLANYYHDTLEPYQNSSILKIANKIYIKHGSEVKKNFKNLLNKKFFSSIEALSFANNKAAAHTINTWVGNETNYLIKDLIEPNLLSEDTRLVLINAIYFKGNWVHPFPVYGTREFNFFLDETNTFKVQMMHIKEEFNYGEFSELDAAAVELDYRHSDLSLLIILPNSRTGLTALEHKLQNGSLYHLTHRMKPTPVILDLPKFKHDTQIELSAVLQNLGVKRMFTDDAEFGQMLEGNQNLKVSAAIHKAFIEVNERGTEAAAATGVVVESRSGRFYPDPFKRFTVNRPFYYIIKNKANVPLFLGSIKTSF